MKRRIVLTLLVMLIITLSLVTFADNISLSDIKGHWAESTIQKLVDNKVISGYPDGSFRPEEIIRVDEFLKLCISSLPDFTYDKSITFTYWATPYIEYALDNKIITSEAFQDYEESITREEMALVAIKTLSKLEMIMSVDNTGLKHKIKDYYLISDDMKDSVLRAYGMGLLTGKPGDVFDPKGSATRAEASVVIDRLKEVSSRKPFDFEVPFFTYEYAEYTQDGYETRNLKVLAPKDKNGVIKTDIIDLFEYGEAMKEKFRTTATVSEGRYHIETEDYLYMASYYYHDERVRGTLSRRTDATDLAFSPDVYIQVDNFMFAYDETPLTIGFHDFNKWSYYEEKYGHILDGYMTYIFGEDKDYVISIIDGHMTELMGDNDYSVKNNLNQTYTLKNGRTLNARSKGSNYVMYIGNTK